jgi:hypothetical protein
MPILQIKTTDGSIIGCGDFGDALQDLRPVERRRLIAYVPN